MQNYLGSGWPVDDEGAVKFAHRFYHEALSGETLGDAISRARSDIMDSGSTWGAYQHCGQAGTRLLIPPVRSSRARQAGADGEIKKARRTKGRITRRPRRRHTSASEQIKALGIPGAKSLLNDLQKRADAKKP